jgi:hypothetical protein
MSRPTMISADEPVDEPVDETITRGGYHLPPPVHCGRFAGPADDPDRYELISAGISGGEGTTWRARYYGRLQAPLPLAVKQLRSPAGDDLDRPSDEDRRHWQDQAALLRHLRLEHVVRVHEVFFGPPPHDAGKGQNEPALAAYLVMEWVEGPTLSDLCRARPASKDTIADRLRYVAQAAAALTDLASSTRSAGNPSLHRDVKPSNCIINPERGLVLIDISTLRLVDDGFDPAGLHTPQYTPPEVLAAPHLPRTPAADAYSLGALAVYCLTGSGPAPDRDNRTAVEAAARKAGVAQPVALAEHIVTLLDPDPAGRPTDLATWGRHLTQLGRPAAARGTYALAATAGALLLAGFLVVGPPDVLDRVRRPALGNAPTAASPAPTIPAGYAGRIRTPADGSDVKQCSYMRGTATVPKAVTLVLAMRNLTTGAPERYGQVVSGYEHASRLPRWRGAQYFGRPNENVGQDYQVELIALPLTDVRVWDKAPGSIGLMKNDLIDKGVVLDTIRLHRIDGPVDGCTDP